MTLGSECAVPPKPSKIKHKRMQSIPKCLPFTSHRNSNGLKPLTENKLMTTAAIWPLFLTPAALLRLSPMSVCSSSDIFWLFQVHQELKGWMWVGLCEKDLVWQGFRGQAVVCCVLLCCRREHVRHWCDLPQRQLGLLHAQDPRKKMKKASGNLMNYEQQEQHCNKTDAWATSRLGELGCNIFAQLSAGWGRASFTATATLC